MVTGHYDEGILQKALFPQHLQHPGEVLVKMLYFQSVIEELTPYHRVVWQTSGKQCVFQSFARRLPGTHLIPLMWLSRTIPEEEGLLLIPDGQEVGTCRNQGGGIVRRDAADRDAGQFEQGGPPAQDRRFGAVRRFLGRGRVEGAEGDIVGPRLARLDRQRVLPERREQRVQAAACAVVTTMLRKM